MVFIHLPTSHCHCLHNKKKSYLKQPPAQPIRLVFNEEKRDEKETIIGNTLSLLSQLTKSAGCKWDPTGSHPEIKEFSLFIIPSSL